MAQAHLSSLDLKSVDREEPSSGEEEEQRDEQRQQTALATSGWDIQSNIFSAFVGNSLILSLSPNRLDYTFEIIFMTDPRDECRPLRNPFELLNSSTERVERNYHHDDKEKATESEEGRGE